MNLFQTLGSVIITGSGYPFGNECSTLIGSADGSQLYKNGDADEITSYSSLPYAMQKIFGFKGSSPLWVSGQIATSSDLTFLLCVACGMKLTLNNSSDIVVYAVQAVHDYCHPNLTVLYSQVRSP